MRIAIVTGGSRGLGQALCTQLAHAGYHLIEFSRSAPHKFSSVLDLTSPLEAARSVAERLSPIDPASCEELLLFSNAGTLAPIGPAWRKAIPEVTSNLNANLVSAISVVAEVVRHFRESDCRKVIINISSGAALKGYAGWSLYCAAKAGMESFVRALAKEEEHQAHPFLPISVDPGVIDTEMQALIRETPSDDFPEVDRFKRRKAAGGLATPESVAAAIIQLIAKGKLQPGGRHDPPPVA